MTDNIETNDTVVELKDVSLHRDRRLLLEDVSWTVRRGEHWAVLGRNGAGKTLLLRIAAGYLWPSRGEVRVLSEYFGRVDLRRLRRDVGWVSSALAEKIPPVETAREVVLSGAFATFGLYDQASREVEERGAALVRELGLERISESRFGDLSAGEKQRVLLARARMGSPRLLILDEPCAGLDLAARERLLDLVQKMSVEPDGPTMVMVTHRAAEIRPGFTHALLLGRGRVLAAGPIREVLTDERLTRALEIPVEVRRENGRWAVRVKVNEEL